MSYSREAFDDVVDGLFTPQQIDGFEQYFTGRYVEQLYPGREELLEAFDKLSIILDSDQTQPEKDYFINRFLLDLANNEALEAGRQLEITDVRSCVVDSENGKQQIVFFPERISLVGNYCGIVIGPWYDAPLGEFLPEDLEPYKKPLGLYICLSEAVVEYGNIPTEELPVARIPLNHGAPELFGIIRKG